ncbi:VOC family protein [Asanoa sp. WMMD1127]|uniref:VOC family protein n=1 Tax=Asanoa sp. WMMD1127 TaxID=3016107 RepID=UPI0024168614|nr:VOC family protein [Asanoa sp. WMMD1127]MDG4827476.1 VOC family protein [Asanoa sp. WMMD1127]
MSIVAVKDICLDADDAPALARFWATVLGGTLVEDDGKPPRIDGVRPGDFSMWVNPVPEPRVGKTRVHLDLRLPVADPAPLVAAGARIVRVPDAEIHWWVLADPEGNLFDAFPPRAGASPAAVEVYELVVDSADPVAQAAWWASVTGGRVEAGGGGAASVVGAAGFPWDYWVFDPVPERKTVKNRLHWDVDLTAADPGELVAAGATVLREPDDDISWWIMADPEGNEFCAFAP